MEMSRTLGHRAISFWSDSPEFFRVNGGAVDQTFSILLSLQNDKFIKNIEIIFKISSITFLLLLITL